MYMYKYLMLAIINKTLYNFLQPFLFKYCTTYMDILKLFRECKNVIKYY